MKDCTVLVSSCDSYKDILDVFFELLKRFWPNLNYEIVLSTETLNYKSNYFEIKNIHPKNKDCTWTERMSECLEQIKTKYVILILDDFFFYDYVDENQLNKCLLWMNKNKKISAFLFYPIFGKTVFSNYEGFKKLSYKSNYTTVAAILGLWNKKKLLKYTKGYKENIWEWEKNATRRNKKLYKNDEFYVTKKTENNVFFYDFTKYGLFSGKWMKDTVDLFKKLNITYDFDKRGFYEEALRGLSKSIIDSFTFDSALIPNYNLKKSKSFYLKPKKEKYCDKNFYQIYNVRGATDIIRWEPCTQWGFAIKNLKILIEYNDNDSEVINNNQLFGNFTIYKDLVVFNTSVSHVLIPTEKNRKINKIIISGRLIFPLEKDLLYKTYQCNTKAKSEEVDNLIQKIYHEFLGINEKLYYIDSDPKIVNENNLNYIPKEIYKKNKFKHVFLIDKYEKSLKYYFNNKAGYSIKNLEIIVIYENKNKKKIKKEDLKGKYIFKNNFYVFLEQGYLELNINNYVKKIVIKGELIYPIKRKILREILKIE